jgi:hypothetical protein
MGKQNANTVLMIQPVAFGYNSETEANNFFQQRGNLNAEQIHSHALTEFNEMVKQLQTKGIRVIVVNDTTEAYTPDSIFPNNWVTFHEDGSVVIYPVFAQNRRLERRYNIIQHVIDSGFKFEKFSDYTCFENQNYFLEGTGSMVFDHENRIIYAALSARTSYETLLGFCGDFDYTPVIFSAFQTVNQLRLPIYHTNVMLCVANNYAVVCLECIDDKLERENIIESLRKTGKVIIAISEKQMCNFAGNMLQLENIECKKFLVMSETAYNSLEDVQINKLTSFNELIVVPVPTVEKYGGGSVRCMMAEVF